MEELTKGDLIYVTVPMERGVRKAVFLERQSEGVVRAFVYSKGRFVTGSFVKKMEWMSVTDEARWEVLERLKETKLASVFLTAQELRGFGHLEEGWYHGARLMRVEFRRGENAQNPVCWVLVHFREDDTYYWKALTDSCLSWQLPRSFVDEIHAIGTVDTPVATSTELVVATEQNSAAESDTRGRIYISVNDVVRELRQACISTRMNTLVHELDEGEIDLRDFSTSVHTQCAESDVRIFDDAVERLRKIATSEVDQKDDLPEAEVVEEAHVPGDLPEAEIVGIDEEEDDVESDSEDEEEEDDVEDEESDSEEEDDVEDGESDAKDDVRKKRITYLQNHVIARVPERVQEEMETQLLLAGCFDHHADANSFPSNEHLRKMASAAAAAYVKTCLGNGTLTPDVFVEAIRSGDNSVFESPEQQKRKEAFSARHSRVRDDEEEECFSVNGTMASSFAVSGGGM